MWRAAGDRSADFSFYTKRATLAAVYSSTSLFQLKLTIENLKKSWGFLDLHNETPRKIPKIWIKLKNLAERPESLPRDKEGLEPGRRADLPLRPLESPRPTKDTQRAPPAWPGVRARKISSIVYSDAADGPSRRSNSASATVSAPLSAPIWSAFALSSTSSGWGSVFPFNGPVQMPVFVSQGIDPLFKAHDGSLSNRCKP